MIKANRAGVIPWLVDGHQVKMLFMRPSNFKFGGPDFQIAKGRIEKGETPEEAAKREALEELGLLESNVEEFKDLGIFLGKMQVFLAKVKNKDDFSLYSSETGETNWLTLEEYREVGRVLQCHIVENAILRVFLNQPVMALSKYKERFEGVLENFSQRDNRHFFFLKNMFVVGQDGSKIHSNTEEHAWFDIEEYTLEYL